MQKASPFHPPVPSHIKESNRWSGLYGASVSLTLSQAIKANQSPLLIITADSLTASRLADEINIFSKDSTLLHFPDWETLPYDRFSPHQDIISDRLATLYRLPFLTKGAVITTVNTLMQQLPPRDYLNAQSFLLKLGDVINIDVLRTRLVSAGYYIVNQVREHGEVAIRGSIIDLFPMGSQKPYRIDLFDNEIETIRFFSTETQRSLEKIDEINLLPAKEFPMTETSIENFRQEWRNQFPGNPLQSPIYQDISEGIYSPGIEYYFPLFFTHTNTLFDYLPQNTIIVTFDYLQEKAKDFWQEIILRYNQGKFDIMRPLLAPEQLFIPYQTIQETFNQYPRIEIVHDESKKAYCFTVEPTPVFHINHKEPRPLAPLQHYLQDHGNRVLFCAESTGRREILLQLFETISLSPMRFSTWHQFLASQDQYGLLIAPLDEGFSLLDPPITVIAETQLYGKRVMQRRMRKKTLQDPDAIIKDLTELQIGDPVVHIDHGIGRYLGLETLEVSEQITEFLCLEYQGGDKLYVPVSSLHLITRYAGADPEHTPINKLGTDQWQKTKRKAAEKIRDIAAELLDLYAHRAARPGEPLQIPMDTYATFAAAFPFEETPDQLQAIEQVFADMTSTKPMDRVICGDVGFGKTEVALRAAFLAVFNSKQVAVLVPTTLLAQQHFSTFQDRFADWPVKVEVLSRFRTAKEQKNILTALANGGIDIIISTHKLLQPDIAFKSLGLMIIDEEHRFGVKQKEKLKALRTMVDILTLTATPIPRTLNMTLSGIRDLSVIATPPARRLSIKTFVHEYSKGLIQEAMFREILRGGQVYFLHNDIKTIDRKLEELKTLVPEARMIIAHGQMHERNLEKVMSDFYHRRYNVLICTTIIESGIDIPSANTMIINRADKFGLAQLHQLRGRVGRSHHQAYAYLLIPGQEHITADAVKRLDAISQLDELGIGFTLATHDLEIRGAGELLGEEQSGRMHEIGFSLYMDLLSRAVEALKSGQEPLLDISLNQPKFEIDLRISALIPDNFITDVTDRLQFYKRIASAKNNFELDEIQVELIERFGLLPQPTKNLFALNELRLQATPLGIIKLEANEHFAKIEFNEQPQIDPRTIIQLIQQQPQQFKMIDATKLKITLAQHIPTERISLVRKVITMLQ